MDVTKLIEGILIDADLVKFAKYTPVPSETKSAILVALDIVERDTKPKRRIPKMFDVTFANKGFLFLLLLIPALSAWYHFRQKNRESDVRFSKPYPIFRSIATRTRGCPALCRLSFAWLALTLLIFALAVRSPHRTERMSTAKGFHIVRRSLRYFRQMLVDRFSPNRMKPRKLSRATLSTGGLTTESGLVIFSSESFTQCPLTVDYGVLKNLLKPV